MRGMKAFTLTEIMITIAIMSFAIFGIMNVAAFYSIQAKGLIELADCQSQLNFAADDIKLHLMSASSATTCPGVIPFVSSIFSASGGTTTNFTACGEKDVYTITPNNITDNVTYTYIVSTTGSTKGCLVRRIVGGSEEILVDARYTPEIEFTYTQNDPPNFMTAKITGHTKARALGMTNEVVRLVGVRFWFVNITI